MSLLLPGRNLCNRPFIYISYPFDSSIFFLLRSSFLFQGPHRAFFKADEVKPNIIISAMVGQCLLVLDTLLA